MYFIALATDYDGTIAEDGVVADATLEALHELKQSGRKLLLVTGRQLPDLRNVLPEIALFDLIVAENGGLLFDPKTGEETLLSPQPPQVFLDALRARDVPVSAGRCIVATWEPHQHAVLEAIRELGLELQIIFNKGAVMVLPAGVSKASGLEAGAGLAGIIAPQRGGDWRRRERPCFPSVLRLRRGGRKRLTDVEGERRFRNRRAARHRRCVAGSANDRGRPRRVDPRASPTGD